MAASVTVDPVLIVRAALVAPAAVAAVVTTLAKMELGEALRLVRVTLAVLALGARPPSVAVAVAVALMLRVALAQPVSVALVETGFLRRLLAPQLLGAVAVAVAVTAHQVAARAAPVAAVPAVRMLLLLRTVPRIRAAAAAVLIVAMEAPAVLVSLLSATNSSEVRNGAFC